MPLFPWDQGRDATATLNCVYQGHVPTQQSSHESFIPGSRQASESVTGLTLQNGKESSASTFLKDSKRRCEAIDRGTVALIRDLKQRGLLDETLVI